MSVPTVQLTGRGATGIISFQALANQATTVKLGRIRSAAKKSVLMLDNYIYRPFVSKPPPEKVDYSEKAAASIARMYVNDQLGDCVIAGKYHATGVWTGNDAGQPALGSDQEVIQSYHTICGPGDNGCIITDVLDYFKAKGLPFGGVNHKIDGYVGIDHANKPMVQVGLYLFGALTIGINLPEAWTQSDIWDVTNTRSVGGHDVTVVGYDSRGVTVSSWGRLYLITWPAFTDRRWVDECYAMLAGDWTGSDRVSPAGLDVATLTADLAKLGGGELPDIPDVPPGPPTPVPPAPGPTPHQELAVTLSGRFPTLFGHETVTITGTAGPRATARVESGNWWMIVIALLGKYGPVIWEILPMILADVRAKKSWAEIVADVVDYILHHPPDAA